MEFSATTFDIRISVRPAPIEGKTAFTPRAFPFVYKVEIENNSETEVVLLERYWVILSGGEPVCEEIGPGIEGVRPVIEPGGSFSYVSETEIDDPVGAMYGTYTFRSRDGRYFEADIPKFDLIYQKALN